MKKTGTLIFVISILFWLGDGGYAQSDKLVVNTDGEVSIPGNVGIGTDDPQEKLDVLGNAVVSGQMGVGTNNPQTKLDVDGGVKIGSVDNDACSVNVQGDDGIVRYVSGQLQYCNGTTWVLVRNEQYSFGGAFAIGENYAHGAYGKYGCEEINPVTRACSCPAGYTASEVSFIKERHSNEFDSVLICWKKNW